MAVIEMRASNVSGGSESPNIGSNNTPTQIDIAFDDGTGDPSVVSELKEEDELTDLLTDL